MEKSQEKIQKRDEKEWQRLIQEDSGLTLITDTKDLPDKSVREKTLATLAKAVLEIYKLKGRDFFKGETLFISSKKKQNEASPRGEISFMIRWEQTPAEMIENIEYTQWRRNNPSKDASDFEDDRPTIPIEE